MNIESLTNTETQRLRELEEQIESNIAMIGRALFEIRESRLYRLTHSTFEGYCQERFAMGRNYINRQIQAAEVMNNLVPIGTIPKNEAQARPLASLPKEDQPTAWEKAQDMAKEEGKPLAARHVEKAAAEIKAPTRAPRKPAIPSKEDVIRDQQRILGNLKAAWAAAPSSIREEFLAWVDKTNVSTNA